MFLWTGPGFDVTSFETYSRHTRPIKYIITTSQMLFVGFWPTCMEMVWPHVLLFNNTNGFANAKCKNNKAYYLIVIHLIGDISYFVSLTLSPNTVNGSFPTRDTYSLWGCVRRVKSNTWSCPLWRPLLKVVVALSFLLCAKPVWTCWCSYCACWKTWRWKRKNKTYARTMSAKHEDEDFGHSFSPESLLTQVSALLSEQLVYVCLLRLLL